MVHIYNTYVYLYTIYIIIYVEIHMNNKERVIYPYIHSAIWPVPHNDDIPIPIPPDNLDSKIRR